MCSVPVCVLALCMRPGRHKTALVSHHCRNIYADLCRPVLPFLPFDMLTFLRIMASVYFFCQTDTITSGTFTNISGTFRIEHQIGPAPILYGLSHAIPSLRHAPTHTPTHIRTHTHTYAHTHTHTHACTHARTHAHIHAHAHIK